MAYSSAVAITPTVITRAGTVITTLPTTPTATHGNKFRYSPDTVLIVANGSGGSIDVTIEAPGNVDGQAVADLVVAVAAGARTIIGPFTPTFVQSDGYVWAVFSSITTITIGAYALR